MTFETDSKQSRSTRRVPSVQFRKGEQSRPFSRFIRPGEKRRTLEEENMLRMVAAATLVAAFVGPALAADEFYVVQDVKTKRCSVVDKKPVESSTTVVSPSGTVYKTRSEAETSMKSVKVCTSN
jgi:hypothetical protein